MIEWIKRNKAVATFISIKILCIGIGALTYILFGHRLIQAMYEGHAIGFLNHIIDGSNVHPLHYYYTKADKFFIIANVGFLSIGILVFSLHKYLVTNVKEIIKIALINIFVVAFLFECLTGVLFAIPSLCNIILYDFMRALQRDNNVSMPQYEDTMAHYDSELTYILNANSTFYFSNPEFRNKFTTNSLGLRDDEISLQAPEIISLGDSYAMGWGVEPDETYAQVLERGSKMKVLNAGISSYGTIREMKLLNHLDVSNAHYLIIQYDSNDYHENNTFYQNDNQLPIMSNETYECIKKDYKKKLRYYPGKHLLFSFKSLNSSLLSIKKV